MRGEFNFCIVILEELGLSLPPPLPYIFIPVLQILEVEFLGEEKQKNQIKVS